MTPENVPLIAEISAQRHILVAEDDLHVAFLLQFLLKREGYVVEAVHDGQAAKNALESASVAPSLILLDLMMPYIDGFEIIRIAREMEMMRAVPIVIISGRSQEQDIIRALDAGATDYVVKPFQPGELLARLRRHMENPVC